MFKIIFSHLSSQSTNKPSIASKLNNWSIARFDLNINRFENILFFYKKELLNSKLNTRKSISYSYTYIIDIFFYSFLFLAILGTLIFFFLSFFHFFKTSTFTASIKFSLFFLVTSPLLFKVLIFYITLIFCYYFFNKNKRYLLLKFKLLTA